MALQNIGAGNRDDAFYRYKMPKLVTKIEGRGNGIKTNLVNMVDVAKALARPPAYTTKYFGCELGAQSKFDEKTGISLVNGAHDNAKLAGLLENFIKKYVQCYGCGNPETEILISKTQMITLKCAACGFVSDVDMRDKLTTFILKNPPEQKKGGKDKKAMRRAEKERLKEGEAIDEDQKKVKKEGKKKKGHEGVSKPSKKKSGSDEEHSPLGSQADEDEVADRDDDDDGVQWQTDTSIEAAKKRIQEQLTSATSEMVMLEDHEESRKPKPSKKPSFKNGEVEAGDKKSGFSNGGLEKNGEEIEYSELNKLKALSIHDKLLLDFKDLLQKGKTANQLGSYLKSLKDSPQEIMTAYFEALFDGCGKGFSKEVAKKKVYLAEAVQDENSQLLLLTAVEEFCKRSGAADAVKEVSLVLKVLYDEDILEEDLIFQWYDKGSVRAQDKMPQLWKNVKPFVEWLRSAEAESEEE